MYLIDRFGKNYNWILCKKGFKGFQDSREHVKTHCKKKSIVSYVKDDLNNFWVFENM